MKICFLGNAQNPHIISWMNYFSSNDYEVHIISDINNTLNKIKVHYIHEPKLIFIPIIYTIIQIWYKVFKIRRILKIIKPDILHAHWATNYGFLAALSGFHPYVLTSHGSDILIDPNKSLISKCFVKYALRKADLINSVADHVTKSIFKLNVRNNKIVTFQYGIDTSVFNSAGFNNNGESNIKIISVRDLEWRYNVDMLIKAIPIILIENSNSEFLILGDGPQKNGLINLTRQLSINKHVKFLGLVKHNKISEYYRISDIYVSTSLTDGSSIALVEALACGLFPIVTDIPANREWIIDGKNGFLVSSNSHEELAKKTIIAINDVSFRKSAYIINQNIIYDRARRSKNMKIMETCYNQLVNIKT